MAYTLPPWADSPATTTPLNAANLTQFNTAINDLDTRVASAATTRANLGVNVAAPSGDTTGATDTPIVQAAIDAGGLATLAAGTYWVTGVTLKTGSYLRGQGVRATTLKLAAAANTDVVTSSGFASLTMSGNATWGSSGISDCGLAELTVDGNSANQSGTSHGVRVYGYNWIFRDLEVVSCLTHGLWTEWGSLTSDAPATSDGSESSVDNVKTHHNGQHGWVHLGPSDCRMSKVMAFKNNQANTATSIGFWGLLDTISNIMLTAASMNGTSASGFTGTFTVNAATPTALYGTTGTLKVTTSTGTATMTYTGKTTTTFTGCTVTSGSGTFQTGNQVVSNLRRFTSNGLQLTDSHVWSNSHTWSAVLDGQSSVVNCHMEGAGNGELLLRSNANVYGGFYYDLTPIAPGCGIQLGDDGNTLGLPASFPVTANAVNIKTRVHAKLCDTSTRSALRWVSSTQSDVEIHNVVKQSGTFTATVASGSNGVDVSTFTSGSPGVINVASTNQIPSAPGTITVVTALGTITCTYTTTNASTPRNTGTQLTGVVASGASAGSTMSTGAAVSLVGVGTAAYGGTPDPASRLKVQSSGQTSTAAMAASIDQEWGPKNVDVGPAANAFRLKNNGVDQLNLNTSLSKLQLPNAQNLAFYSDNYVTQKIAIDGSTGVITGPTRAGKAALFPGPAWVPGDHGLITATGDPIYAAAQSAVPVAGTVYHSRVHCPVPFTATNVILMVGGAGASLTAGQCFAGLCSPAGTMVGVTADLSSGASSFAAGGSYTFPLAGGPFTSLAAGDYTVCFFFNGTTGPALARFTSNSANQVNMGLTAGTYRSFTDSTNTGRTTTFPASKGTETSSAFAWFAGIS